MSDDLLRDAKDKLLEASSPYIPSCAEDEQWCKYRDELCDRIQQRLDTGGWLPIETAPKDGTVILCYFPSFKYESGHEHPAHINLSCWRVDYGGAGLNPPHWSDGAVGGDPTHWQPLPDLPREK